MMSYITRRTHRWDCLGRCHKTELISKKLRLGARVSNGIKIQTLTCPRRMQVSYKQTDNKKYPRNKLIIKSMLETNW